MSNRRSTVQYRGQICRKCGKFWGPMEVDHVWPRKWKGPDAKWNYQTLCRTCNRRKGAKYADYRLRNLILLAVVTSPWTVPVVMQLKPV